MKKNIIGIIALSFILFVANANAIQKQEAMNWCWAACVQDVLFQAGIRQS